MDPFSFGDTLVEVIIFLYQDCTPSLWELWTVLRMTLFLLSSSMRRLLSSKSTFLFRCIILLYYMKVFICECWPQYLEVVSAIRLIWAAQCYAIASVYFERLVNYKQAICI
jgi:hypothetical protein